jgi:hypothetical protein
VITELELAKTGIESMGMMYRPPRMKQRSLGGAIFLVAIADYRGLDEQEHKSAEQFLYPKTRRWRSHYDWAVALTDGVNPAWLRDALDRFKDEWDERRALKIRRAPPGHVTVDRRDRPHEKQRCERIRSGGQRVPAKHKRSFDPAVQPAREACSARPDEAAPSA